ncbi:hypothetical protein [Compostimonas suwonensis]|uniref:Uncharacterized protein n=1 Tax=Compostimonas suwonensis TaxID=1048394 RepID=A0A2M9C4J8_9MICO|nr:hypothetical protein [Compostimonas suwonensis]PJJ65446.1 hypothetical protein CLV54_0479 [Compostimonas suwonensis]
MNRTASRRGLAGLTALVLAAAGITATATAQSALAAEPASPAGATAPLANTAHLDFLLDTVTPAEIEGHTSYRLDEQPQLTALWTYADARDGGAFERVGGGPLDLATGHWGQGSYNADDIARAAVVYLRHWTQTGAESSKTSAYELLRSLAYLQTTSGENAGNVVLWMQPDGTLNPSPEPVELPDPSDSGPSYWLARSIWAFGEGYAAFVDTDPEFAAFLRDRLGLGLGAIEREALDTYGQYVESDGVQVPAWLIVDGADASAEASLGLSAYLAAAPDDTVAREALRKLTEGIAALSSGSTRAWPYGALMPWAQSRSMWHAWSSQMPAALATASTALGDPALLDGAILDSTSFTPTLLTAGGPDNAWYPTPIERVQIAYGADSRLQSLLSVADAAELPGLLDLAALEASWYFGSNASGEAVYDPATGVTVDGVAADGTINRNSGAESTIHGLLSMLALDAHPQVAQRARSVAGVVERDGLTVVEGETAASTTGAVATPESAWTGESQFGGGAYLELTRGQKATFDLGASDQARLVEPVSLLAEGDDGARSLWSSKLLPLGVLEHSTGARGISPAPGALLPQQLSLPLPASRSQLTVTALSGTVDLDALIVRPVVSRLELAGEGGATQLVHSAGLIPQPASVGFDSVGSTAKIYDASGELVRSRELTGTGTVLIPAGGFAIVTR